MIALLPVWLFLSLALLWVGGSLTVALGITGTSETGTLIGVITLVLAGAVLFGGPIWSLRRLGKVIPDRAPGVPGRSPSWSASEVRVRGINLGKIDSVAGCATFLVLVVALLVGTALAVLFSAVSEAIGAASPEGVRDVNLLLMVAFMAFFPVIVVWWVSSRIRGWIYSHADE